MTSAAKQRGGNMKLRYKKIILITTMSTMGIGLLTLSIGQREVDKKEKSSVEAVAEGIVPTINEDGEEIGMLSARMDTVQNVIEEEPNPSPTPIATPTPLPVYDLEENKEMNKLFEDYYMAKSTSDVNKIKSLYSDPTTVESVEELESKVMHIEEYRNIKSYSKKGMEEGSEIVYVYHEIKFTGINTLAPGLAKFYVITDDKGEYKIFSNVLDEESKKYFDARNQDDDVLRLIEETNNKSEEAKEKDEALKIFWEELDNLVNN